MRRCNSRPVLSGFWVLALAGEPIWRRSERHDTRESVSTWDDLSSHRNSEAAAGLPGDGRQ